MEALALGSEGIAIRYSSLSLSLYTQVRKNNDVTAAICSGIGKGDSFRTLGPNEGKNDMKSPRLVENMVPIKICFS